MIVTPFGGQIPDKFRLVFRLDESEIPTYLKRVF